MKNLIRPSLIGRTVPTDARRYTYDIMNSVLIDNGLSVDICFIGDSITEFWEINAYFKQYGMIINRGIGGDTPYGVLHRFDGDVVQLHPRVCVCMIGVNEVWQFTDMYNYYKTESETRKAQDLKVEELAVTYRNIFQKCKDNRIVLLPCSVMPVKQNMEKPFDQSNHFIRSVNDVIRKLAEEFGFSYVDYYAQVCNPDGTLKDELAWDSVHPHVLGYNLMYQVLKPYLDAIFNK